MNAVIIAFIWLYFTLLFLLAKKVNTPPCTNQVQTKIDREPSICLFCVFGKFAMFKL